MKSIYFLLLVGLTASFVSANGDIEMKNACLQELERELSSVVIPKSIWPLMEVFSEHYPDKTFEQMPYLPKLEVQRALEELPYPKDCKIYLESFKKAESRAKCLERINFDEMFRWMLGSNEQLDSQMGASHACELSLTLHSD